MSVLESTIVYSSLLLPHAVRSMPSLLRHQFSFDPKIRPHIQSEMREMKMEDRLNNKVQRWKAQMAMEGCNIACGGSEVEISEV